MMPTVIICTNKWFSKAIINLTDRYFADMPDIAERKSKDSLKAEVGETNFMWHCVWEATGCNSPAGLKVYPELQGTVRQCTSPHLSFRISMAAASAKSPLSPCAFVFFFTRL